MKKAKWISLALAASVLASTPSFAVPIDYLLDFNAQLGPSGTGSFSYDADTRLLTNLKWDFGSGMTYSSGPIGTIARPDGGTSGSFLAELLLRTDLDPSGCINGIATLCRSSILSLPSFSAPGGVNSISFYTGIAYGNSTYYSFSTATAGVFTPGQPPQPTVFGPTVADGYVTARLAVSEPSTIALLMLGMLTALGIRRRSR